MIHPVTRIRKIFIEITYKDWEQVDKTTEYTDKFITWIIGFCIAGLSLLLSNDTLSALIGQCLFNFIIKLIVLSVIFGIFYRLNSRLYNSQYYLAVMGFIYSLTELSAPIFSDIEPYNRIDTIQERLMKDFDMDLSNLVVNSKASEEDKIKFLKDVYKDRAKWDEEQSKIEFDNVQKLLKKYYGLTDKELKDGEKVFNSKKLRFLKKSNVVLFSISLIMFLSVFLILFFSI